MEKRFKNYLVNLIFPAVVFGSATGIITAVAVILYKVAVKHVIHLSETGYSFLRERLWLIPIVLAVLFWVAVLMSVIYKRFANLRGGGIPTSIGILRGLIPFNWIGNFLGVFFLSLVSFLIGVPLGNEGPAIQMGTALGRGSVRLLAGKHRPWDRYSMTGGACAGFSVATGAPISGIFFAIEEAHQRISPMIIIVSSVSVLWAKITTTLLCPLLGVSPSLFPHISPVTLSLRQIWIPLAVGLFVGLFAVLFLKYYCFLSELFNKKLKNIPRTYKIFAVFTVTIAAGLFSSSFVSTGHELILSLFDKNVAIYMLLLILLFRSTLTLAATTNQITGGLFLPMLALGTVVASALGRAAQQIFSVGESHYTVILVLGITACIASLMKTPITAIIFAVEVLGCYDNVLYVIIVAALSFIITEIFGVKSISDTVLEDRIENGHAEMPVKTVDTTVTVKKNAFAIGKQVRDIFWPANLFVLSVSHSEEANDEIDEYGGKTIIEGDSLHVRYSTGNEKETLEELYAIVE